MAISDKLEYLNDTKQLLKDKINNLGGSITDQTTFRQYVDQLDGVYDVLPKTEFQEGTSVTIEGGLKGKIDFDEGKVGFGDTEQDGEPTPSTPVAIQCVTGNQEIVESGKQLISFPYFDSDVQDRNGVNWSVNENGTINANGTANASSSIFYLANGDNDIYLEPGTYKISTNLFTDANGFSIQAISIVNGNYGTVYWSDMVLTERTRLRVRIIAKPNATVNVQNAYMMIEPGSTATTYEPYHTPITYPISLGSLELCKIGDYADELLYDVDEDKVYKKAEINEDVFSNDDTWYLNSDNNKSIFFRQISDKASGSLDMLCEIFKFNDVSWQSLSNYEMCGQSGSQYIFIRCDDYTNTTEFKSATNGKKIIYPLATPTLTELTDTTLKQQVKNWYYSQSFSGTTIIESNGDLPMIIKVRALKGE